MNAAPMVIVPLLFRVNFDILFWSFIIFYNIYGLYLHCGYEADWIVDSDHWLINTSFQHYVHHAKGETVGSYTYFGRNYLFVKKLFVEFPALCASCH